MTKTTKLILTACCSSILCAGAWAQEKPKMPDMKDVKEKAKEIIQPKKDEPAQPDPAAAMAAWEKASKPGAMHEYIAKSAGTWDCVVKMFGMPGASAEGDKGSMTITMIMGGRYSHMSFKGTFMGMPYEGAGTMGFNNVTNKFESTWLDNQSTVTMLTTGELDKDGKVLTLKGEFVDPMTNKTIKTREVDTRKSDNETMLEFYHSMDGKEQKVMEITMKRSAAAPAAHGHDNDKDAMSKIKEEAEKKLKELQNKSK